MWLYISWLKSESSPASALHCSGKKQQMTVWGRGMDWWGNLISHDIYKKQMIQCNSRECNSKSCLSFFRGCIMTLNIKFGAIHSLWQWTHSRYLQQWIETHISVHQLCKFSSDLLHILIETKLLCLCSSLFLCILLVLLHIVCLSFSRPWTLFRLLPVAHWIFLHVWIWSSLDHSLFLLIAIIQINDWTEHPLSVASSFVPHRNRIPGAPSVHNI